MPCLPHRPSHKIDLTGAASIHDDTQLGDLIAKDVTITSGYKIEGGHGFRAGTTCTPPPSCTGSGCPVPEPSTLPVLGAGLVDAWLVSRRFRRQRGLPEQA
ncbi:MAG: PEP-CTERM sorting domain-containing protein [Alphaproteobacteria bacterium]|nr:PEP-CTERM sorting domain-containing protein [Alphaproteobacteria bacterium]